MNPLSLGLLALVLFATPAAAQYGGQGTSPRIYSPDGTYLGNLNNNRFDPDSVNNRFGRHGNPYNPNSINNPYGRYGSPYSPYSPRNPYAR